MHVCTVLINGICHRALRCISRFTLAPPGLCLALCFAPSARLVPSTRRGCIRSRNTGRVVHFYPPLPYFSLPSLITLVTLLMLWLQSLRHSSRTEILRRAPANCQIFPCYDTRYLISYSLSKLFRRSLVFGSLVFRCTCFSVFFPLLFLAFNGNTFRCLCHGKNEGRQGLTKQRYGSCFEPIGWVHRWTIHFSISHSEASRSSLTDSALAKTRDFCHRVMYDPASSRIARWTSVENNCLSCP